MTMTKIVPFDPWAGQKLQLSERERAALHPVERPPLHWPNLSQEQRELLGGLALHVLRVHAADADHGRLYLTSRLIEALHATHERAERGGFGHDLAGYYQPTERMKWHRLDIALQSPPLAGSMLLAELLDALRQAGDLGATLRARRAALDAQIARLAKIEAAAAPDAA